MALALDRIRLTLNTDAKFGYNTFLRGFPPFSSFGAGVLRAVGLLAGGAVWGCKLCMNSSVTSYNLCSPSMIKREMAIKQRTPRRPED